MFAGDPSVRDLNTGSNDSISEAQPMYDNIEEESDDESQPSAKRAAVASSEPEEQKIQGSAKQKIQGSANQVVTWQIKYGLDFNKESRKFLPPLSTKSYKNSRNESALFYDVSTKKFQDEFGSVFLITVKP